MAPLVLIVFLGFLAISAPLPTLPLHLHDRLGFTPLVVGWVIGLQSICTVLTRHNAGALSDRSGPRRGVLLGLPVTAASGLLSLLSMALPDAPGVQMGLLLAGRVLLGLGESLFVTATMIWGIARLGAPRTGIVMSWQGIALYASIGIGAFAGLAVQARFGFGGVAVLGIAAPLLAMAIALAMPGVPAAGGERVPFHRVVALIWQPGLVLALATVPFAAMAAFLALDFAAHGWGGAGLALAGFSAAYIGVRLVGSHWSARFGGAVVCTASMGIEVVGQAVLWLASGPGVATLGAVLTGVGFSLVFPAMGVEATRRIAPAQRGRAVGGFIAFFDVALGLTGPVVGLVVGAFGTASAFLVGALAVAAGLLLLQTVRRG